MPKSVRAILLATLLGGLPAFAAPGKADSLQVKSPTGAMLRSLALPGWGQWYNGRTFKALLVTGAEVGLVTDAIVLDHLATHSGNAVDRAFYLDNKSLAIWWLAGVILYSMADAYVDAHLYHFDESPDLGLLPSRQGKQTAWQVTLAFHF
jgi:hypothetical protein